MHYSGFAPMSGFGSHIANNKETRFFVGDGTPYLPLIGDGFRLAPQGFRADGKPNSVRAVHIGQLNIPHTERRSFPLDAQGTHPQFAALNYRHDEVQNWTLGDADDGTPCLLRAEWCGDGIWPKGQTIAVTADWLDTAPAVESAPAKK